MRWRRFADAFGLFEQPDKCSNVKSENGCSSRAETKRYLDQLQLPLAKSHAINSRSCALRGRWAYRRNLDKICVMTR
jgi:hypothetical protein